MSTFIFLETYNPLNSQGTGKRYINFDQIVSIQELKNDEITNHRIKNANTRIILSSGHMFDIREKYSDILNLVKNAKY